MRKPVIAGNWKMYKTLSESVDTALALKPLVANANHCEVVIAPVSPTRSRTSQPAEAPHSSSSPATNCQALRRSPINLSGSYRSLQHQQLCISQFEGGYMQAWEYLTIDTQNSYQTNFYVAGESQSDPFEGREISECLPELG